MGCAASKEMGGGKKKSSSIPKKLSLQRALKSLLLDGILLKDQRRRRKQVTQPLLQISSSGVSSSPSTLREILQKGEIQPEISQENLEVINVWELMRGLEDDPVEDRASTNEDSQDLELGSPSISSPESGVRNFSSSPTSPLYFESPVKGRASCSGRHLIVTRNFSFNLRSNVVDQQATPKVILDSKSPLLQLQHSGPRIEIPCDEGDNLLSCFELMMDQIARDSWENSPGESQNSEVILYLTAEDQESRAVESIIGNHGVSLEKRNISSDLAYAQAPALFIDGRYIGGAEQVRELEAKDQLKILLDGARSSARRVCNGCCGICLVPCLDCNGSRRFMAENGELEHCTGCTEEGMVNCPMCS